MEKFDAWLDQIHAWDDEFAYRTIYSVYSAAESGHDYADSSGRRRADGTYEIYAGQQTIVLADDAEREALAAHIVRRYCGDHYPDMRAWEAQEHAWYIEDRHPGNNKVWAGPTWRVRPKAWFGRITRSTRRER
ncbi:hypothetical protein [Nocardia heshunensis]